MLFLLLCSSSCPHLYLGYFVAVYYSEFGSANRRVLMQLSTRPLANASKSCYVRRLPEGQCNVVTSMKSTKESHVRISTQRSEGGCHACIVFSSTTPAYGGNARHVMALMSGYIICPYGSTRRE